MELAATVGRFIDEDEYPPGVVIKLLPTFSPRYMKSHFDERREPDSDLAYIREQLLPSVIERDEARDLVRDQLLLQEAHLQLLWTRTLWHLGGLWPDARIPRAARRLCRGRLPLLLAAAFVEAGAMDADEVREAVERLSLKHKINPDLLSDD